MKKTILLTAIIKLFSFSCSEDFEFSSEAEVLFISRRIANSADWQMVVMDRQGDHQRILSEKIVRCSRPVSSNNGSKIAFTTYEDGTYHLYIIDNDGQNLELLSKGDQYCGCPSFSPDNTKIVFSKNDNPGDYNTDIYIIDIGLNKETRLTDNGNNSCPSWCPSGDKIVYATSTDSTWGIYAI